MDPRLSVRTPLIIALAAGALASCGGEEPSRQPTNGRQPQAQPSAPMPAAASQAGVTPMNQRVAVLGLLNKRNGIVRDLSMRPGQALRVKDIVVRLRACETTAPWENPKFTGAFVQVESQISEDQWQRVFSGWLYKESPSLNVVEHPVYDVWVKSCAMTFPAGTPLPDAPSSSNRSSSPNSGRSGPAAGAGRARADANNPA